VTRTFLTCGARLISGGPTEKFRATVVKFNIAGSIIWKKLYDIPSPYNGAVCAAELPNGELQVAGALDTMQNYQQSPIVKVRLLRIDKDGNLIWARDIGSAVDETSSEYVYSITPTKDKGFVLSTSYPFLGSKCPNSMIKIDSTVCDSTEAYCRSLEVGIPEHNKYETTFELFPNPASDAVKVQVNGRNIEELSIKVLDVSGREIEVHDIFDHVSKYLQLSHISAGIYFISLFENSRIIETKKLLIVK